jgi:hypothetical protein
VAKLLATEADLKHQADFSAARATKLLMDNRALQLELDVNSPKLLLQQVQVQYELMTQQKAALEAQLDAEIGAWQEKVRMAEAREQVCHKQLRDLRQGHSSSLDEIDRMERQVAQQKHQTAHLECAVIERDQELRRLHEQVRVRA